MSLSAVLEGAGDAARASRFDEALKLLLAAYDVVRDRELADAIERVSAACSGEPPTGKRAKDRLESWLAIARRGRLVDLAALLPTLAEGKSLECLARLDALAGWPADPRLGRGLVAVFEALPFQGLTTRPTWERLFQLMVVHGDPLARDRLRALVGRSRERAGGAETIAAFFEARLKTTLEALDPKLATQLPDDARAALARLAVEERRTEKARPRTEGLWAAVYADPDDDAARLVLADALSEAGDPRGELISLQFQRANGGLDAAGAKREAALLSKHEKAWLGALAPVLLKASVVFEKGFVAKGSFRAKSGGAIVDALKAPEWVTMREISGEPYTAVPLEIVRAAHHLRVAHDVAMPDALALFNGEVPSRLEELGLSQWGSRLLAQGSSASPLDERARSVIGEGVGLPSLRSLRLPWVLRPEDAAWLFASSRGQRLEELGFPIHGAVGLAAWLEWLSNSPREGMTVRLFPAFARPGTSLAIRVGADGRWSSLEVHGWDNTLPGQLHAIPTDALTRFSLQGVDRPEGLDALLARQKRLVTG